MSVEKLYSRTPPEVKDAMLASEFNLWCAMNGKPYRMARHVWPDGAWEWDVEYRPGRPEGTIAYGTGQEDEALATLAAFAFVAGVEWQESLLRQQAELNGELDDEEEEPAAEIPRPVHHAIQAADADYAARSGEFALVDEALARENELIAVAPHVPQFLPASAFASDSGSGLEDAVDVTPAGIGEAPPVSASEVSAPEVSAPEVSAVESPATEIPAPDNTDDSEDEDGDDVALGLAMAEQPVYAGQDENTQADEEDGREEDAVEALALDDEASLLAPEADGLEESEADGEDLDEEEGLDDDEDLDDDEEPGEEEPGEEEAVADEFDEEDFDGEESGDEPEVDNLEEEEFGDTDLDGAAPDGDDRGEAEDSSEVEGSGEVGDGGEPDPAGDTLTISRQDVVTATAPLPVLDLDLVEAELRDPPPPPYNPPPVSLLQEPPQRDEEEADERQLADNARSLETVLRNFKVRGEIMEVKAGPVVTLYEFEPVPGTKSSTVINLSDDIARSMAAITARIAVVPGRSVIGIELPNPQRETVYLRDMLESSAYTQSGGRLPLVLGKDIGGQPLVVDLAKMPHLLIAGTTGSGKSVGINTMILSLLYRLPPERCRLIMVDPKMLELSVYDGIPHLLTPVVTDPKKAVVAMKWAVKEMESRYRSMAALGVRNIEGYNERVGELLARGEQVTRKVQVGFDRETGEPIYEDQYVELTRLPYIVVVVDEMADLMLVAGKEIEAAIQRLAQMARAAGIHLIMATQRPSVDVITGTIKANFPTRISFQVTSKIDSRTILGEQGAEQLLGQGDMLYMAAGGRITRVHGPFVSDNEVQQVVNCLKVQGEPDYLHTITEEDDGIDGDDDYVASGSSSGGNVFDASSMGADGGGDPYDQALALVLREGKVSVSFIQRHLQIGYNRAARIVERMEQEGIISAANHVGKRDILADPSRYLAGRD